MRERRTGTLIDVLDEFETKVMAKYPFHRQTMINQKAADQVCSPLSHRRPLHTAHTHAYICIPCAQEREDNMPPQVLDVDSDYSENGSTPDPREIQSQYWYHSYFTLFISIWAYLCSATWIDRRSALSKGDAVTVEPDGESIEGSAQRQRDRCQVVGQERGRGPRGANVRGVGAHCQGHRDVRGPEREERAPLLLGQLNGASHGGLQDGRNQPAFAASGAEEGSHAQSEGSGAGGGADDGRPQIQNPSPCGEPGAGPVLEVTL